MKWARRNLLPTSCARQPLDSLLAGTLDDRVGQRLAQHLDTCETCQQRLTELAAEPDWWLDASRWLEPVAPDMDPCVDDLGATTLDEFDETYPSNERDLLDSGLLAKSDDPAMLGTLGRYEVKRVIGAGGTGIVLQAIDTELNRTVAIKVLSPTLAAHGPARKRFARESQAVAAVAHENVVAVHHVEGGGRVPYLVMQYVDGDSLQDLVIRDGPLDVTTTLRMTAQLAAALTAAHDQGLVHRDVKPANILVGPVGQRVWMTDFGLARAVDDASLTRTGFIAGTPHYMSPEQARGATVRASSDLFGLGGVVYFMLTGRPPFRAERTLAILNRICTEPHRPVREVNSSVPPEVARLVDRLLAKSAGDRFANAEAVRTECLRLLADQTSPDDNTLVMLDDEPTGRTPTRRRRYAAYRMLGSIVALTLLAGCIAVMVDLSGQLVATLNDEPTDGAYADPEPIKMADAVRNETPVFQQDATEFAAAADYAPAVDVAELSQFTDSSVAARPSVGREVPTFDPYSTSREEEAASAVRPGGAPQPIQVPADSWSASVTHSPVWTRVPPATGSAPPTPTPPGMLRIVQAHENVDLESAVWQLGLSELEQALTMFETQSVSADNQPHAEGARNDLFDDTLHWMEVTAAELEQALPIPSPVIEGDSDRIQVLPGTTIPNETLPNQKLPSMESS